MKVLNSNGFRQQKKQTSKQIIAENSRIKQDAKNSIDSISKLANQLLFETGQDLASAECMVMMLKDLVWQVARKEIYPHELKHWLEKFEAQESFEGTNEELAESLGLGSLQRDYTEIYLAVEKRIAERLAQLDAATLINKVI